MRTTLPTKVKRVLKFVHDKSKKNHNSWMFIPMHTLSAFEEFGLHPIRDYLYFRAAEKMGLIHMKYNESNAKLTLQGKNVLGV